MAQEKGFFRQSRAAFYLSTILLAASGLALFVEYAEGSPAADVPSETVYVSYRYGFRWDRVPVSPRPFSFTSLVVQADTNSMIDSLVKAGDDTVRPSWGLPPDRSFWWSNSREPINGSVTMELSMLNNGSLRKELQVPTPFKILDSGGVLTYSVSSPPTIVLDTPSKTWYQVELRPNYDPFAQPTRAWIQPGQTVITDSVLMAVKPGVSYNLEVRNSLFTQDSVQGIPFAIHVEYSHTTLLRVVD